MLAALPAARRVAAMFPSITEENEALVGFDEMARQFRMILGREAWSLHGRLIERHGRPLSPAVADNFEWARHASTTQAAAAHRFRREFIDHLSALLGQDGVLVIPTCARCGAASSRLGFVHDGLPTTRPATALHRVAGRCTPTESSDRATR